jgi:Na+(H+)/acetate symporter ActP
MSDARTFDKPAPPTFPADTTLQIRTDAQLETGVPVSFGAAGVVDGEKVQGLVNWAPGLHTVEAGAQLQFKAGTPVPTVAGRPTTDRDWLEPMTDGPSELLRIYSLLIAGFLGTMGMPHVLIRFYTNPDGRAARRTTLVVLTMIGAFYIIVSLLGAFARLYTPQLMVSGADAAVLLLPTAALGSGWGAALLGALIAAGAVAAFLATSSGLTVSLAGVLFTDVLRGRLHRFRLAAALSMVVPLVLALTVTRLDFSLTVPLVFAMAAATFCPLIVLGIWWRGLTPSGAIAGMLVGGVISAVSVLASLFAIGPSDTPLGTLLYRPALVAVPAAFLVMWVVSRLTRAQIPPEVDATLLRMHAPERLGLGDDRLTRRPAG